MGLTLQQLLNPATEDDATTTILGILSSIGFASTSWQAFAVPRLFVRTAARLYSTVAGDVASIAAGGLLDLAAALAPDADTGRSPWLDLLAISAYGNPPFDPTTTVGTFQLVDAGGAGPTTISANQLIVTTPDGLTFTNTAGGTLTLSGLVNLPFSATSPGASYNLANNYTPLSLVTTLPGVTVSNPIPSGQTSWITTQGTDPESTASLVQRCKTKWPTLSSAGPSAAYINWARTGDSSIARVVVDDQNPDGPGTVRVYCASASGAASSTAISNADAVIQLNKALTATVATLGCANVALTVAGTVYVVAASYPAAAAAISAALSAIVSAANVAASGRISYSQVMTAMQNVTGVSRISGLLLNTVADDFLFTAAQVLTLTTSLTFFKV